MGEGAGQSRVDSVKDWVWSAGPDSAGSASEVAKPIWFSKMGVILET